MNTTENLPALTLDITQDTAPAIFQGKGLDHFFDHIKASVNEVPDLSTKKGRDRIASLSAQVSRSKTAVEKPGREYLQRIKAMPKLIEVELRDFVTKCDALRDEVRKPLTDWEAEQDRIEAERKAAEAAAKLAEQVERDHELALLMNAEFDRNREQERLAAEQAQREREERIAREAAERARLDAEAKAKAEQEAALRREMEAKLAAERAEQERVAAEQRAKEAEERAEREKVEAEQRAIQATKDAEERAERMRLEAIEQERRRQEAEAAAEAEELRRREADKEHKKRLNGEALADMIAAGLTDEMARAAITAIAKRQVRHIAINY